MSLPRSAPAWTRPRRLVWVLGDQLGFGHPALGEFDPAQDHVLLVEAPGEFSAPRSHRARIVAWLAARRHFCNEVHRRGWAYTYVRLDEAPDLLSISERASAVVRRLQPEIIRICEPGEWRHLDAARRVAHQAGVHLEVLPDPHFLCSREAFANWARGRPALRLAPFYRDMRRRHRVLMDGRDPAGGRWRFEADPRQGFPPGGPEPMPWPERFDPDPLTRQVMALVQRQFPDHPGSLDGFAWPVTRAQALQALERFVAVRLRHFGAHPGAMWTDTPWGGHSLLSVPLNLHLLDPREVLAAAEAAWREQHLPLASVEAFVHAVLGEREFARGVYGLEMPALHQANHFGHQRPLPRWFWTGQTRMACLRAVLGQALQQGYTQPAQRLHVVGAFALLAGLAPQPVADWFLALHVDGVEWAALPNTLGPALYASGPRLAAAPRLADGPTLARSSNYCAGCRYHPAQTSGALACPLSTLHWHFIETHAEVLGRHPDTAVLARRRLRLGPAEREAVRLQAAQVLAHLDEL